MGRLDGRSAIVTGAAKGLGRAIATRLARDGAYVVAGDIDAAGLRDTVQSITEASGRCVSVVGDSTDSKVAEELAQAALADLGRIDVLVNNVGGTVSGKIWELSEETWDAVIRLNLRSMFLCTRAVVTHMMQQHYGRIVSISSGAREGTPWQAYYSGAAPYSTAKAGVHGFTRDVSLELAEYGINVNCVAPGPLESSVPEVVELRRQREHLPYEPTKLIPLRRLGQPAEIAAAVSFLASDEASYITGQTLTVNGGR